MRVRAISTPDLQPFPTKGKRGKVRVKSPIVVDFGGGVALIIEPGLWSDGASVPSFAWMIPGLLPLQLLMFGIIHDATARRGMKLQLPGRAVPISFGMAQKIAGAVLAHYERPVVVRWGVLAVLQAARPTYWRKRELGWRPD